VPTAVTGTLLLFFALGKPLTITAYIGVIMLVGIAVNDSIVLMDAVLQLRRAGMNARDAVLEAGQRRLRPILMTTLTALLGMLPLTFGFGEGTSLRAPMALAVIGGLLTSTLLTLVVIPSVYFAIERMLRRELSTSLK
jgi:HAE1 family hydrophobic/amphiphilic exporter-1